MTSIPSVLLDVNLSIKPLVKAFFDKDSHTISYVVRDPASSACAVVDSVLDIDYAAGRLSYTSADAIIEYVRTEKLAVDWLIETHVHADHLSAAPYLQKHLGGRIGIGANIVAVQETFGKVFNEGTEFQRDGSQFDKLFHDGESYRIGGITAYAILTPGHTPACMTHVIGDATFVGDTLFMPDAGSARADFPGGDARELYRSIQRVLSLPDEMRVFVCHDYGPNGRNVRWETTVAEQKQKNIHVASGRTEDEFVALRESRDKSLSMPKLIIPSIQINMRAGHMPSNGSDGGIYLTVPINKL
jgi:glyoxylase-like metal-dependent hydrolase (beta-lactamase superfamily II)